MHLWAPKGYEFVTLLNKFEFGKEYLVRSRIEHILSVNKLIFLEGMPDEEKDKARDEVASLKCFDNRYIIKTEDLSGSGESLQLLTEYAEVATLAEINSKLSKKKKG